MNRQTVAAIPSRTAAPSALPRRAPVIHQPTQVVAEAPARDQAPLSVAAPGIPALPAPTPAVAAAVRPTRTWSVCDDRHGFSGVREEWLPPRIGPEDLPQLREHLAALEELCMPADRGWLLARVLALLSHYRQEANPSQVEFIIAEDWADDLGEYPAWAVEEAARRWRRTRKFRPAICEIREFAETAMEDLPAAGTACARSSAPPPSTRRRAANRPPSPRSPGRLSGAGLPRAWGKRAEKDIIDRTSACCMEEEEAKEAPFPAVDQASFSYCGPGIGVLSVSFFTPAYEVAVALTRSAFSPGSALAAP